MDILKNLIVIEPFLTLEIDILKNKHNLENNPWCFSAVSAENLIEYGPSGGRGALQRNCRSGFPA